MIIRSVSWLILKVLTALFSLVSLSVWSCWHVIIQTTTFVLVYGRYLCDYTYYTSLYLGHGHSAFIHVPPLGKPYSRQDLGRALQAAVQEMLKILELDPEHNKHCNHEHHHHHHHHQQHDHVWLTGSECWLQDSQPLAPEMNGINWVLLPVMPFVNHVKKYRRFSLVYSRSGLGSLHVCAGAVGTCEYQPFLFLGQNCENRC